MNDDKLTLYYYNDGLPDDDRRTIREALQSDPDLARHYEALCSELARLQKPANVPAGATATARWHAAIESAASPLAAPAAAAHGRSRKIRPVWWSAAVAAALIAGIGLGSLINQFPQTSRSDSAMVVTAVPGDGGAHGLNARLSRGLQVHLRDSRQHILALPSAGGNSAALIGDIVAQNRLFARAAQDTGSQDLARLLRALEPVLLELADDNVSPEQATALRAQLEFELNVVLGRLRRNNLHEPQAI